MRSYFFIFRVQSGTCMIAENSATAEKRRNSGQLRISRKLWVTPIGHGNRDHETFTNRGRLEHFTT